MDSDLVWSGDGRTDFKFKSAALKLPKGKSFDLPPFGKGWFNSLYVDSKYRLTRDVRGDLTVFQRR